MSLQVLDPKKFMYAVSQGAMAVECRANDKKTIDLLASISDGPTQLRCVAERAMLKKLVSNAHAYVPIIFKILIVLAHATCCVQYSRIAKTVHRIMTAENVTICTLINIH